MWYAFILSADRRYLWWQQNDKLLFMTFICGQLMLCCSLSVTLVKCIDGILQEIYVNGACTNMKN